MDDSQPTVGLALQGGGSHTAFTWGVLDGLSDEVEAGRLRIAAISGTTGGGLNGAVCAYGLVTSAAKLARFGVVFATVWTSHRLRAKRGGAFGQSQ